MIGFTSCKKDNKAALSPCNTDTSHVIFANVKPIFVQYCDGSGCHAGVFTSEAKVKAWTGHFDKIVASINHKSNTLPMPDGTNTMLLPCDINKITAWYNSVK
jgi:hypothetical protein